MVQLFLLFLGFFLFIGPVLAGAVVFLEFAGWALVEVEVEFFIHGFVSGLGFDLDHGGVVIACWDGLVGDKVIALLGEREFGGCGAFSEGYADFLGAGCHDLVGVINETDFDLLVLVDEEFHMGFHGRDEPSVGWASFLAVVMVMFIFSYGAEGKA